MLLHVFNDDNSISILTDLEVVIIENTHKNYDKIAKILN